MPRIEKFRMAGIRYDKMKKHYENTLFDLTNEEQPHHTLLTLVNGGGKGMLLQMLFQLMMPLTPWGKKGENHIDALFYNERQQFDPYTFHVAAEWRLDTDPVEWLVTGICVTSERRAGAEEQTETEPQYFLYTGKYRKPYEWELAALPFYDHQAKAAVNFTDWEQWLKKHKLDFQLYSKYKSTQYFQFLQNYGIERSEWRHMRDINRDEGGIEHYFKNGLDNHGLFHHLIIPEISNYMQDEQTENLVKIFKDNAIIAQKLPKLLKREEAFQEIQHHLIPLKKMMEEGLSLEDQKITHEELASYIYHGMEQQSQALLQEREKWLGEKEKAAQHHRNLLWEQDNLEFAKANRAYLELSRSFDQFHAKAERLQQEIARVKSEKENQEISILLDEYADITRELEGIGREIDKLEQQHGLAEEKQQLEQIEGEILGEWQQVEEYLAGEMGKYEALQARLEREIKDLRLQQSQMDELRIKLGSTLERYTMEIRDHYTRAISMEQAYGRKVNLDPEGLGKEVQKKIAQRLEDKKEMERSSQMLVESKEAEQLKRGELVQAVKHGQEQLQRIRLRKEQRLAEERDFHSAWCHFIKEDRPFAMFQPKDLEQMADHLQRHVHHSTDQILKGQKELWKHQLDTSLLDASCWVPNDDLRRVKETLEDYHIPVSYGGELIRHMTEEERRQLSPYRSLLPYGLVIHQRDWERRIDPTWFSRTLSHAPVPIFIRENMDEQLKLPFEVFSDKGIEMAYDPEKWMAWKENLSQQTDRLHQLIEQWEQEKNRQLHLLESVKELQKKSYFHIEEEEKEKQLEVSRFQQELAEVDRQIALFSEKILAAKAKMQELEQALQQLNRQAMELEGWVKQHEAHQENVKKKQQVAEKLTVLEGQSKEGNKNVEQQDRLREAWTKEYWKWQGPLAGFLDELRKVLPAIRFPSATSKKTDGVGEEPSFSASKTAQLKRLLGRWNQLHGQWMNRDSELIGLKKDRDYKNAELVKLESRLMERDPQWRDRPLPTQHKEILTEQVRLCERQLQAMQKEWESAHTSSNKLEGQLIQAKKQLATMEQAISKEFQRGTDPWEEEDLAAKQEQIEQELRLIQKDLHEMARLTQDLQERSHHLKEQQRILSSHQTILDLGETPLSIREQIGSDPEALVQKWTEKNRQLQDQLAKHQVSYKKGLRDLTDRVQDEKVDGPLRTSLQQMIFQLETHSVRASLDIIQSVIDYIELELLQLKQDKEKSEQAKAMWVDRAVYRVISILSALKRMVAKMRIKNQEGHMFSLVQIEGMNEILSSQEDEYRRLLDEHFVKTIDHLLKHFEQIESLAEKEFEKYVSDSQIVLVCLRNRYPTLSIYKPQTTNAFLYDKPRKHHFTTWETLNKGSKMEAKGSGGQLLAARTIIMMMIMTFKRQEDSQNWTVLIMDNPFGQAVSAHILDPIFSIADVLRFQWIVLAPPELIKLDVSRRFPVYWKLELQPHKRGEVVHEVLQHGGRTFEEANDLFSWM